MHILVTGAAGFIGSAVAAALIRAGHTVVGIDTYTPYYDPTLKRKRVAALLPATVIHECSITDSEGMYALCMAERFDVVCHLAAQAGVRYSVSHPETYIETNIVGTQTILSAMQKAGITKLVQASTSSVYGVDTPQPFSESAPADRPVSVYAATKRAAELIAHAAHATWGLSVTNVRFFTVYGPWSRPDMALIQFAEALSTKQSITLFNHGNLIRDFTHIDDIVRGFVAAVDRVGGYHTYNLGSGRPLSVGTYLAALANAVGEVPNITYAPMQVGDVYETAADITKAKQELDFNPTVSLEEGIASFVAWYRPYRAESPLRETVDSVALRSGS